MPKTILLAIDADYYIFAAACRCEIIEDAIEDITATFSDLQIEIIDALDQAGITGTTKTLLALSCRREDGFRRDVLPSYKANRDDKEKPALMGELVAYVKAKFDCIEAPRLEADDVLGILGSAPSDKYEVVMVSIDKDLKTIPGLLYNSQKKTLTRTDEETANYHFFMQCLMGDSTDGYPGLPRCGPKRAALVLDDGTPSWGKVLREYREGEAQVLQYVEDHDIEYKSLRNFAMTQARVARILRFGEWRIGAGPVLWMPPGFTEEDE